MSALIFHLPENVETRWASPENPDGIKGGAAQKHQGRKGRANIAVAPGQRVVLAHTENGSGVIHRIWATINDRSPAMLRSLRFEIYWDGAATPAVSAPMADFFGQGLGRMQTFESIFFSNPEERSFNCVLPMPFQKGFSMALTNESTTHHCVLFYDVNYTLGDQIDEPVYLHAHWCRENPTTIGKDYEVLPKVSGRGRYLGANFGVIADKGTYLQSWWGEGECKIFLDGDTHYPTLAGTGTEDYIGTAWGQGRYAHLNQGCPLADYENCQYAFYRYHVPDPIYFQRDIRVVFQQIGGFNKTVIQELFKAGHQLIGCGSRAGEKIDMANLSNANFIICERTDDWSSCCYFYLNCPENKLPPLAPAEERTRGLLVNPTTVTEGIA